MEQINFTFEKDQGFKLLGFPNAEKVIALEGPDAQELADMALHKNDLDDSFKCLDCFVTQTKTSFEQSIFWKMSIIYFMKCFGKNNSRETKLDIIQILGGDSNGQEVFDYFKSLRNKNIAHDENAFSQCLPCAVINKQSLENKVAKIACLIFQAEVSSEGDVNNLRLLITKAQMFVQNRMDQLCKTLTDTLERVPHADLLRREAPVFRKPEVLDMGRKRPPLSSLIV